MPPTPSEVHQTSQSLIAEALAAAVKVIWPELDLRNLDQSKRTFLTALMALVKNYGNASSVAAAKYFRDQRALAKAGPSVRVALPPLPPLERVQPQIDWAVSDLYGPLDPAKTEAALTKVQGVAEAVVLDQGRATLTNAVESDRKAKGWARVPEQGACHFCLLLATRGAVYKSRKTSDFEAHDHCRCSVEPLWGDSYEPTAQVRAAHLLYQDMPRTGNTINDFRVALKKERDAGRFPGSNNPSPGAKD